MTQTQSYHFEPVVMALGFFDGVHLGHQQLIRTAIEQARALGADSAVMSFENHPLTEIFPRYTPVLITNNTQKVEKIRALGIDYVFLEPFTQTLMCLSPRDFVKDFLLKKFNIKGLVVGFNYTFGYKGEGTAEDLERFGKEYGFEVTVVHPYLKEGVPVSSTLIRELLGRGDVDKAAKLLGEPYSITGVIRSGKKLGRRYKIPTANLQLSSKAYLPKNGVYFTRITVDGRTYDGLTNLGYNPTFDKHPYAIETYIYDFDKDIYGKTVRLEFLKYIRGDMKFENVDALFKQIRSDIVKADMLYRKKKRE